MAARSRHASQSSETITSQKSLGFASLQSQLTILGMLRLTEAIAWTTIFPYIYFMVQSFPRTNPENTALFAGSLVAVFTFCEFISSIAWAKVSDKIGRKPTLLLGILGGILSAGLFGFAKSMPAAILARALGGLLNPNVGVVPTCVGELVRMRAGEQAKSFSVVPFLRGLGSLLGPVIGGNLAQPVKLYPSVFKEGTIWDQYPFLLPNLVVVVLLILTWTVGFLFLQETHPTISEWEDIAVRLSTAFMKIVVPDAVRRRFATYSRLGQDEVSDPPSDVSHSINNADIQLETITAVVQTENDDPALETSKGKVATWTTQVILQILSVSLLAFHKVSSDIIIPMFLAEPKLQKPSQELNDLAPRNVFKFAGGFGMDTPSVGNVLLSQALVAVLAQRFAVPAIIARFGALTTYRWVQFAFPLMYCLTPFVLRLPQPLPIVALVLDLWIKVLLVSLGYVCSAMMITNVAPSPGALATINGAAAAYSCLARSAGPLSSGELFGWGQRIGFVGVAFWNLAVFAALGALESCLLRDKV